MSLARLTREQAAIVSLYTGVLAGPFEDVQELAATLLGRPVFTHELGSGEVCDELKELVGPVFVAMASNRVDEPPDWSRFEPADADASD